MKHKLLILLVLSLILSGCMQKYEPDDSTVADTTAQTHLEETSETVKPTEITNVYTHQPMVAVSVPAVTEHALDQHENIVFTYTYQHMQLILQDPDVADRVIIDFLNRIDQTRNSAESIRDQALIQAESEGFQGPYLCEVLYEPMRIDQSVLSLFGTNASYSGGFHADQYCDCVNYDLITGDILTLGSILTHSDALQPLCDLVISQLDTMIDKYYLMDDYPRITRQRFNSEASYDEDWYFTQTGLCFYFEPYEIAPYSSGIIHVEIPYESLTGIISDAFFPPESELMVGTVYADLQSDIDVSGFQQIAEVNIDQGGERIILHTDGAVKNIRLESGIWNESGTQFIPEKTIFATASLMPGDAVMIETFIPDGLPVLRFIYYSNNEPVSVFISQSGKDGSILLISE